MIPLLFAQDAREVGEKLDSLADLVGSRVEAEVAIVYNWAARWAFDAACGPIQSDKRYAGTYIAHYRALSPTAVGRA